LASGASGKLKILGRAGVGVDNIDIEAATKNNVVVLK
jgi:D-3-phosphoglycerate dehydrogenase / 2-oxoglutarate reductase